MTPQKNYGKREKREIPSPKIIIVDGEERKGKNDTDIPMHKERVLGKRDRAFSTQKER